MQLPKHFESFSKPDLHAPLLTKLTEHFAIFGLANYPTQVGMGLLASVQANRSRRSELMGSRSEKRPHLRKINHPSDLRRNIMEKTMARFLHQPSLELAAYSAHAAILDKRVCQNVRIQ